MEWLGNPTYHGGRPHQEPPRQPGQPDANQLRAQRKEELEPPSQVDVVKRLALERQQRIGAVRIADADVGHQDDHDMLLDGKGPRIQRPRDSPPETEPPGGHGLGPETAQRVDEQLDDQRREVDGRAAHGQEHVEPAANGHEEHAEQPRAHRVGDFCAIRVAHRRAHFLVRRVFWAERVAAMRVLHDGAICSRLLRLLRLFQAVLLRRKTTAATLSQGGRFQLFPRRWVHM